MICERDWDDMILKNKVRKSMKDDSCVYRWCRTSLGWLILVIFVEKKLDWPILYYNCEGALWRGVEEKV